MRYVRYKNREENIREIRDGEYSYIKRVVIYQELIDEESGITIELPSVLNGYLNKYKNQSISNAKNAANIICPFINYCMLQVEEGGDDKFESLKKQGFAGLDFYHAASYLNYCLDTRNIARSTAMQYTDQILNFYKYFAQLGILDKNKVQIEYVKEYVSELNCEVTIIKNPFNDANYYVSYPDKTRGRIRKINNMDEHFWQLFLKASEEVSPDITLAIAFQFFGGLRRGEVVNLAVEDMIHLIKRDFMGKRKDTTKMDINICDRQDEFFLGRDVDISKCGVKQPKPQQVFNFNGKLYDYYNKHIKIRNMILAKNNKITNALFVNEEGLPMTGEEFEKKWYKVKRNFLKLLENESYANFMELTSDVRWGTHIGRGIFTNLCLIYGFAKNTRTLANLRRDDWEFSSKPYIDAFNLSKQVVKSLNAIASDVGW